jgi:hypothetical protein
MVTVNQAQSKRTRFKWTPESRELLQPLAASGFSIRQIAQNLGCSAVWVKVTGRRMGIRFHGKNGAPCRIDRQQVKELAMLRFPARRIAQILGYSLSGVKCAAREINVQFHGKGGKPRRINWEKAMELAAGGVWLAEACRLLEMNHSTALYISRKMGFTWPAPPVPSNRPKLLPGQRTVRRERQEDASRVERMMALAERVA